VASPLPANGERLDIYQGLARRNRLVAILRIGVPVLGAIALSALLLQIYVSNLASRFGIDAVTVTSDTVSVLSPEYAGLLEDGSAYRVWASSAQAALARTDRIALTDAALSLDRASGVTMDARSQSAELDLRTREVTIEGVAEVTDTTGTSGQLERTVFDWGRQRLDSAGPVHIDYQDGTTIDAASLIYDAKGSVWTFKGATVTLPRTPGSPQEDAPTP
jgi:lipopolysaccharide export system protein LptC